VYDDTRLEMNRHDESIWQQTIDHRLPHGFRRLRLDLPTDDPAETLA
jgi:hypothetical protein